MDLPELSPQEYRRYGRHLTLAEVGESGQRRLKAASALVVGAGGLGSPVGLYLAAAGVGRITLADFDVVDVSNLQRQVLFEEDDVGRPKALRAAQRLSRLNPRIVVEGLDERVSQDNVARLVGEHDVVVDGSDNFTTRYLVNDAAVLAGRPYVYGSIFRFEGQASVFGTEGGPCYRCLFPEPPPAGLVQNCAQAGVLGVLPGIVGSIQAAECLKILLGIGPTLAGRLLLVNALDATFREVRLGRDPACALCGDSPTLTSVEEGARATCLATTGGSAGSGFAIDARTLSAALATDTAPVLVDVREEWEHRSGALPGSIHLPLGEVPLRAAELPADREIVVYCSVGPRGERAVELLKAEGLSRTRNLEGGLAAWRDTVDPTIVVA